MLSRVYLVVIFLSAIFLNGCVAVQSFPLAARAGDTITLAVGSAEGLTKDNTTIEFISDWNGDIFPVHEGIPGGDNNLRAIVPVYPDKRTQLWINSDASSIDENTGHGSWLTVLVVDLPRNLPDGTGRLRVNTLATYPGSVHINDYPVSIEILPTRPDAPNSFDYINSAGFSTQGDLTMLEVMPHYLIESAEPIGAVYPEYGAIEIVVDGVLDLSVNESNMYVVLDEMEQHLTSRVEMSWKRFGDQTTIRLVSTKGKLNYYEVRASLFFRGLQEYTVFPTVSARYFDVNGFPAIGPAVKISHITN